MKTKQTLFTLSALFLSALLPPDSISGDVWPTQTAATTAFGQGSLGTATSGNGAAQMNFPLDVCVDPDTGKVFVADAGNNRVLRYTDLDSYTIGDAAEAVFGQSGFGMSSAATTSTGMSEPNGLAIGPDGSLWVAENTNNRVLRFDNAATKTSGAAADGVLGQSDFTSGTGADGAGALDRPRDVSVDASGNLFIADMGNNRVVIHLNASSQSDGSDADQVFGQTDFDSDGNGTDDSSFRSPNGAYIADDGTLYVSDSQNNRIMVFEDALNLGDGSAADRQIGQPDFTTQDAGLSAGEVDFPAKSFVSSDGTLLICDKDNNRVLIHYGAGSVSGEDAADAVLGQADFVSNSTGSGSTGIHTPWGAVIDSDGRLYLAAFGNNRVAVYESETVLPDLTVGKTSSERKGDNVYNSNASGQKKSIRTKGKKAKVHCTIGNDGSLDEAYSLRGKGTTSRFKVKTYLITGGKTNVTGAVKNGTHNTSEISTSSSLRYRIEVTPKSHIKHRRASFNAWLRVTSDIDGEVDKVIGKIKNRP